MKSVKVTGYGGLEQLNIVHHDIFEPKDDEVLLKVKACGVNNTEIWMREGAYGKEGKSGWRPEGVDFPRTPGSDIAGTIVKVGKHVDKSMIDKDVVLFPFTSSGKNGLENISEDMSFIGSEYDGGYAEYVVWPANLCFDMPLSDYIKSAAMTVSGLTAWHMAEQLKIQKGETIVVTGANGGVGLYNVQIAANVFGAKVIAIVGDKKVEDKLKELGATHVLSYHNDDLAKDIIQANDGPVDGVLDVVGDALFSTSLQVLKKGGKFCISGSAGGQKTELDFRTLYLKHITMYGSVLGTKEEYKKLLHAVSENKVQPIIDRTFPLEEARDAQRYFKKPGKLGKIVLIPE